MTSGETLHPGNIVILADHREAASPVPAALSEIPGVEVRLAPLATGDYEVRHRCVFERKTLPDFAASIIDGRLFTQAQRLARLEVPSAIIIEGRGSQLAETHVRREALQGALVSLGLVFHIPVLRAVDAAETARLLVYAAQQLQRHDGFSGSRYGRRPKGKRRLQLHILQGLPGIGPNRAEQLLKGLGSVQGVMSASLEKLQTVGGLGPKTAAAILEALRETGPHYGNSPSLDLDLWPSKMTMKLDNLGRTLRVSAVKQLAAFNANEFRDWVRGSLIDGQKDIEVDLSQTTFLDSCGLGALVALHKTATHRGGRLRLLFPQPQVLQLLNLTRMNQIFEVHPAQS